MASFPAPLDEFPLHQAPVSMRHPASSDRNVYDRSYFNAHDRSGELFVITGYGIYPNLGVADAFVTVGLGDRNVTVRASDALDDDRMAMTVGPYRIEVIEPLQRIRVVCDDAEVGIACDLTWTGSFPAVEEPHHVMRRGGRVILDAQRFAQVGTWSGHLQVDDREWAVDDDQWVGTRDRSWGIRPIGEAEPAGRGGDEPDPGFGFWWVYCPLRFDDFALILIVQEDGDGTRTLNTATRVWPAAAGRPPEQLGWPEIDVRYTPGSRTPTGATIGLVARDGTALTLEVDCLLGVPLNAGPGYGGDPTWSHGQWRGRGFVERIDHDLTDAAVAGLIPFSVVDHVGRATLDGRQGWGMFEHGTIGRHAPSGFADLGSVAP